MNTIRRSVYDGRSGSASIDGVNESDAASPGPTVVVSRMKTAAKRWRMPPILVTPEYGFYLGPHTTIPTWPLKKRELPPTPASLLQPTLLLEETSMRCEKSLPPSRSHQSAFPCPPPKRGIHYHRRLKRRRIDMTRHIFSQAGAGVDGEGNASPTFSSDTAVAAGQEETIASTAVNTVRAECVSPQCPTIVSVETQGTAEQAQCDTFLSDTGSQEIQGSLEASGVSSPTRELPRIRAGHGMPDSTTELRTAIRKRALPERFSYEPTETISGRRVSLKATNSKIDIPAERSADAEQAEKTGEAVSKQVSPSILATKLDMSPCATPKQSTKKRKRSSGVKSLLMYSMYEPKRKSVEPERFSYEPLERKSPSGAAVPSAGGRKPGRRRAGMRCRAKFMNGLFYAGTITKIEGEGNEATFSVHFDSGDEFMGIAIENVITMTEDRRYRLFDTDLVTKPARLENPSGLEKLIEDLVSKPTVVQPEIQNNPEVLTEIQTNPDSKCHHDSVAARQILSKDNWVTPTRVFDDLRGPRRRDGRVTPRRTLFVNDFKLVFHTKPSLIPDAGLGVFVTCEDVDTRRPGETRYFELPRGTQIDLGPYAPLRESDEIQEHIVTLKNFVHNWKSESYQFDVANKEPGAKSTVYDITDHVTGTLHETAQRCVLSYVNEVCNKTEAPNISAGYDTSGAVHYLLGFGAQSAVDVFRLPSDGRTEVEVKIDYGETYEKARVRNGYPRVKGRKLAEIEQQIANDDQDVTFELQYDLSASEVTDAYDFLLGVWDAMGSDHPCDLDTQARLFLAAVLVYQRAQSIQKESVGACAMPGLDVFQSRQIAKCAKRLVVRMVYILLGGGTQNQSSSSCASSLRSKLLETDLYRKPIERLLDKDREQLMALPETALRNLFLNLKLTDANVALA